jgi:peptidoglycan/xylan/chitin deacetylase (PgdA/CDA1 family)
VVADSPPIPVLFVEPGSPTELFRKTSTGIKFAADILGSVFYVLTRYEEVARPFRDEHGRYPSYASLAAIDGFLERPIADEYVEALWVAMHEIWPTLVRSPSSFRLRLTHDVDHLWAAVGRRSGTVAHAVAGDLLRRRDPVLAARRSRAFFGGLGGWVLDDPFDTFDLLMATSERYGLRSTFYFMAGSNDGAFEGSCRLSDPRVLPLLREIHERGHDVGLHASYATFRSAALLRSEFDVLRAVCRAAGFEQETWGVRQHYLRFENPQTWQHQEAAGFEHDSTLGFADRIGFRAGTGREYPLFDLLERRTMRLRERPLIVMDATLLEYMALDLDDAALHARAIVDACRRYQTDAVVLYHNSSLPGFAEREHYRRLVSQLVRDPPKR